MQKWKTFIFLTISMLTTAFGFANDGCSDPRFRCASSTCFIDNICIAADFLWWKPCMNDMDYAISSVTTDDGIDLEYKSICMDSHPGFRVIAGRPSFYCDWGFIASYNYFQGSKHSNISDELALSSPLIHPAVTVCITELFDEIDGHLGLIYNEWDALITYDMSCCNPCHLFQPFIGVAGINLRQKLNIDLTQGVHLDTIRWKSEYWGVGLRAGIEYQYLFSDCLRFFTIVHGTMLAGDSTSKTRQSFCTEINIKDKDCCLFVPGYHIGLGFIYDGCFCRHNFSLRLGYEFLEWRNLPNQRVFVGTDNIYEQGNATPGNVRSLSFHGLMAGAGMTF